MTEIMKHLCLALYRSKDGCSSAGNDPPGHLGGWIVNNQKLRYEMFQDATLHSEGSVAQRPHSARVHEDYALWPSLFALLFWHMRPNSCGTCPVLPIWLHRIHSCCVQIRTVPPNSMHVCICMYVSVCMCSVVPHAGTTNVKPHVLAPPEQVAGRSAAPPMLAQDDDVDTVLYAALLSLEGASEAEVWDAIESHIAPLATLRLTVEEWGRVEPVTTWKSEVAENVLLLLDPSISADSQQPAKRTFCGDFESVPAWPGFQRIPMAQTGDALLFHLDSPPSPCIDPHQVTSMTVRAAAAYATWIEAACAICAKAVAAAVAQPVRIRCRGLSALGLAKGWMESCGFTFDEHGLMSG